MALKARLLDTAAKVWARLPTRARFGILRRFNPRYLAGAVAIISDEDGRILLLNHRFRTPWPWGLPGGFVSKGEGFREALVRELKEEVDLSIEVAIQPFDTELATHAGYVTVTYAARVIGGEIRLNSSAEILEARFCAADALPEGMYPYHAALIQRWTSSAGDPLHIQFGPG